MSKFAKNPTVNQPKTKAPSVVIDVPSSKHPRSTQEGSEVKTQRTSTSMDSLDHPHPIKTPEVKEKMEDGEAGSTTARAPRDPHGHKLVKIGEALDAAHKTKYLPLGDGQNTCNVYLQPMAIKECGKNWCEVEMVELINGTTTVRSTRVYSVDCEDLLKMCYLHAMANYDLQNVPRLHYEQWVLSVLQEYCASFGGADYTDRGSIARYYLESNLYSFAIGQRNEHGEPSRLEMFFQKRCIRDLSKETDERAKLPSENMNIVTGKSIKAKFEYQIEGYIMCVPEGEGTRQRREEREKRALEGLDEQ